MKKRNLILDFTSLLDVIMIVLFIVLCNTSKTAANAENNAEQLRKEMTALSEEEQERSAAYEGRIEQLSAALSDTERSKLWLEQSLSELQDSFDALAGEHEALLSDHAELEAEKKTLEDEYEALCEAIQALQENIDSLQADLSKLQAALAEEEEKNRLSQEALAEAEEENRLLQEALTELEEEKAGLETELAGLEERVQQLAVENNRLEAALGSTDVDEAMLYEVLLEKSEKVTLICSTYVNEKKSSKNEVEITIHFAEDGSDEQDQETVVVFSHDFSLSAEERKEKNAQMQSDLYYALSRRVGDDTKLLMITVVYTYADINFSQSDLDNITKAAEDLERNLNIRCYIDKVKQ